MTDQLTIEAHPPFARNVLLDDSVVQDILTGLAAQHVLENLDPAVAQQAQKEVATAQRVNKVLDRFPALMAMGNDIALDIEGKPELHEELAFATPADAVRLGAYTVAQTLAASFRQRDTENRDAINQSAYHRAQNILTHPIEVAQYQRADRQAVADQAADVFASLERRRSLAAEIIDDLKQEAAALPPPQAAQALLQFIARRDEAIGELAANVVDAYDSDGLSMAGRIEHATGLARVLIDYATAASPPPGEDCSPLELHSHGVDRILAFMALAATYTAEQAGSQGEGQ